MPSSADWGCGFNTAQQLGGVDLLVNGLGGSAGMPMGGLSDIDGGAEKTI